LIYQLAHLSATNDLPAIKMISSLKKRTHTEYASGVQSKAYSAKHLRTENDAQSPIEIPLSTNEIVRGAIRSLPPQAVEDMLVSAAMRDVSLLKEIKEAYAHLANTVIFNLCANGRKLTDFSLFCSAPTRKCCKTARNCHFALHYYAIKRS
jgi:hypothetical protein